MSTATVDDFDTGEIPLEVGEHTVNVPPFLDLPPAFRRPDATGEIPAIAWHDTGIGIFHPISPAPSLGTVYPQHAPQYPRPARPRRGRGRHRWPSLLVRAWRRVVGAL